MTDPAETVRAFVARINDRDVAGLLALMTPDHRLVDPGGEVVTGVENLQRAWDGYCRMVPDYRITVEETCTHSDTVVLLGYAEGTHTPDGMLLPDRQWRVPAAWRALVRSGRLVTWQVYADNEPVRELMQRGRQPGR